MYLNGSWDVYVLCRQLAGQLVARLMLYEDGKYGTKVVPLIVNLLAEARRWEGPQDSDGGWWCPKTATYTPAGGALEATLVGHTGPVESVACSSDGKYIASASSDKSIRVKGILGEVVGKSLLTVKRLRTPSRLLRFGTLILVRLCKRCWGILIGCCRFAVAQMARESCRAVVTRP